MDTSPRALARALVERAARDQSERDAALDAVRAMLPDVSAMLADRYGATEVWLFGSLAWGAVHEGSDVDLAVRGIPFGRLGVATADAEAMVRRLVELFDLDTLDADFAARIRADGVRLR